MRPHVLLLCLGVLLLKQSVLVAAEAGAADPSDKRRVVHVVYFVPTDRKPEPDYQDRLDRVMREVQQFYQDGMAENGYGKRTFELDRDAKGKLRIHMVAGREPMRNYGRNDSSKVRREVKEALAKENLNIDIETIIIFQLLLEWRGNKAIELGPYVGGGGPRNGTAWVFDDAKLDPKLLASQQPGGYYHGPCTIGEFNSHYIGGVAHELGHALGLPHDCERASDRPRRGRSLMGGGNHVYGQEKRSKKKGAFLSAASALPLSLHPLFTGIPTSTQPQVCRFTQLKATHANGKLILTGQLRGTSKPTGLVARNDPTMPSGDYDAVGWVCTVDDEGRFRLEVGELEPGEYDLRLAAYSQSGDARRLTIHYQIDRDKRPDLQPFQKIEQELSSLHPEFLTPQRRQKNLLAGGTFEEGAKGDWQVRAYRKESNAARRTDRAAKEGKKSFLVQSALAQGNDIAIVQAVTVKPNTRYLLSGWVRTHGVTVVENRGTTGANLCVFGQFDKSDSLLGNQDWTYLTLVFDSGKRSRIEIGGRLGHNGSVVKGSAWFDDLVLIELGPGSTR